MYIIINTINNRSAAFPLKGVLFIYGKKEKDKCIFKKCLNLRGKQMYFKTPCTIPYNTIPTNTIRLLHMTNSLNEAKTAIGRQNPEK